MRRNRSDWEMTGGGKGLGHTGGDRRRRRGDGGIRIMSDGGGTDHGVSGGTVVESRRRSPTLHERIVRGGRGGV